MKITISKVQWEAMGKQAGWMKDILNPPESTADFSIQPLTYNEKVKRLLIPYDPMLQHIFLKKTEKGEEESVALKEIFDGFVNCDRCQKDIAENYSILFNNQNKDMQQLLAGEKASMVKVAMRDEQVKPFVAVMEAIKNRGKYTYAPQGYIRSSHLDISFYDGVIGEAYIQVYYHDQSEMIVVEKYYDNEMMNNEYADKKFIPLNIENPSESAAAINRVLDSWMGNAQKVASHAARILIADDQLQPTDGVQTSIAVNPVREKDKLHCKRCGNLLKKVIQKNPAGLSETVWKCNCGKA